MNTKLNDAREELNRQKLFTESVRMKNLIEQVADRLDEVEGMEEAFAAWTEHEKKCESDIFLMFDFDKSAKIAEELFKKYPNAQRVMWVIMGCGDESGESLLEETLRSLGRTI